MKKKRRVQAQPRFKTETPRLDRLDKIGIAVGIIIVVIAAIFAVGSARADSPDPRYPFLEGAGLGQHQIVAHQKKSRRAAARVIVDANGSDTQVIGGRPAGCPHRYCGCGLARFLGIDDKRLNLAWNWAKLFPRTMAAPGMAAVRHGHVMLLVSHVGGSEWIVRDYNSGRGLSRIHERDVRGYVFVDPSARHVAMR